MRRLLVVPVLAAVTAIAACGGSTPTPGFAGKADALCRDGSAREVAATRAPLTGPGPAAAEAGRLLTIDQNVNGRLEALTPPANAKKSYDTYLAKRRQFAAAIAQSRQAAQKSVLSQYRAALQRARAATLAAYSSAAAAGLSDCAGKLPPDEARTVTSVIVQGESHPTASECTQHTTERFIAENYGGDLHRCEQQVAKARSSVVKVANVRGITPQAAAYVPESGGSAAPANLLMTLIKQNGVWKIDAVDRL